MSGKSKLSLLVEQIKKASSAKAGVILMADLMLAQEAEREETDAKLFAKMDTLERAIVGNGDPEKSLISQVAHNKKAAEKVEEDLKEFKLRLLKIGLIPVVPTIGWVVIRVLT